MAHTGSTLLTTTTLGGSRGPFWMWSHTATHEEIRNSVPPTQTRPRPARKTTSNRVRDVTLRMSGTMPMTMRNRLTLKVRQELRASAEGSRNFTMAGVAFYNVLVHTV